MKKSEFINVSKSMVKEYFNLYLKNVEGEKLSLKDICVIGFHEEPDGYRILLSTPTSDSFYYEVTYDKKNDALHSYAYRKIEKRVSNRNTRNRYLCDYKYERDDV